jgi:dTDP-4-amino-4,6-dideoxygalactose transaminase
MKIPFGDLTREYRAIREEVDGALRRVLASGWFILGEEVRAFERAFARYLGAEYCVSCGNGTEAITLALRALDVKPEDEVITQANTCVPTVCGIVNAGARPVFCDCLEGSAMIDPAGVEAKITARSKAIMPVNLYGASADYDSLKEISVKYGIPLVEDCAQSHGAKYGETMTGMFGAMGCFSFYPSKNLGCYGDGGAVVTNDGRLHKTLLLLRNYGQDKRDSHVRMGMNSRLDEIQAGILSVKLNHLDEWNRRRREIAGLYDRGLAAVPQVKPLRFPEKVHSVYHLYVIKAKDRQALRDHLASRGVATLVHYPVPCHRQEAFRHLGYGENDFPAAERISREILSLPVFPQLDNEDVEYVIDGVKQFYRS